MKTHRKVAQRKKPAGGKRTALLPSYHVTAVLVDGTALKADVASPAGGLEDLAPRAVVIAADNSKTTAGLDGVALGGVGSKATAGQQGLAQVLSGEAIGGHFAVAVSRQGGKATASDGGVALVVNGGAAAITNLGVAIAMNPRWSYNATAQAGVGSILVFSYCSKPDDLSIPPTYACFRVDGVSILPGKPYKITKTGQLVRA